MKLNIRDIKHNITDVEKILKALANKQRLFILCHLLEGEQNAGELWKRSNLNQSAFSQHLSVLRRHQLVKIRKKAQTFYYSLADKKSVELLKVLHKFYCSP